MFVLAISAWLWLTVLFANFAEAVAEGRGKAQAATLRSMRQHVHAKRLLGRNRDDHQTVEASALKRGDLVLVQANDIIPADGEVVEGVASVNESAVTGESAPVLREAGGDFSSVTGGTKVLSDWLVVQCHEPRGRGLPRPHDRARRRREARPHAERDRAVDPARDDDDRVPAGDRDAVAVLALSPSRAAGQGSVVTATVLVALLVCLIPTTIGALLSAIGIAGMDRMVRANVIATSGRAVEAAGDVDVLLLDKTGTITLGDRHATAFHPAPRIDARELADAAQLASLADETPEGRSIVVLAKQQFQLRGRDVSTVAHTFHKFSAQTRMSGVDVEGRRLRKGAADAIKKFVEAEGGTWPATVGETVDKIARAGATPLVVAEAGNGARVLGVIELRDIVKGGIRERFAELREMGIKTIMVTGDNRLTAAAIAAEAGVDEFLAEATPETKLELIRKNQAEGRLVAMCGDGTNDAPALAQADVAVAMNTGTQAAKEAGNMVDLDSNPTKLIEVVDVGKQMLVTRGALTTFSVANDVSKYFAIIPAAFATTYPALGALNVMRLTSPESAIMSAVIFNALIIVALVPLALRGVKTRAASAAVLLRRNLLIYGVGGVIVPFVGIKIIDMLLTVVGLA